MLLMAVALLVGAVNIQAEDLWTGEITLNWNNNTAQGIEINKFDDVEEGDVLRFEVSMGSIDQINWAFQMADGHWNDISGMAAASWDGSSSIAGGYLEYTLTKAQADALKQYNDWNVSAVVKGYNLVLTKVTLTSNTPAVTKYTLTYTSDGTTVKTERLAEGATPTPPSDPTKDHYTFDGWENLPETMPTHDVTATAKFAPNVHTISYYINDELYTTQQVAYGATIVPITPTLTGYRFNGWGWYPETMPDQDVTISGSSSQLFNLTLNYPSSQGTVTATKTSDIVENEQVTVTVTPADGYEVASVAFTNEDGTSHSYWGTYTVQFGTSNITCTVTFRSAAVTTYNVWNGTITNGNVTASPSQAAAGTTITLTPTPNQGYSLESLTVSDGTNNITVSNNQFTMPASNVWVSATFVADELPVATTNDWKATGTSATAAGTTLVNNEYLTASIPYATTLASNSKTIGGEAFTNYISVRVNAAPTANEPNGTEYTNSGKTNTTPIVITTKKATEVTFYYRRQADNNDGVYTDNSGKDLKVVDQANPATAIAGTETVSESDDSYGFVTKKVVLEAGKTYTVFARGTTANLYGFSAAAPTVIATYTLTYVVDGTTYTASVAEGTDLTSILPAAPTKEGYTFTGWSGLPSNNLMPGSNLTVTAQFTANQQEETQYATLSVGSTGYNTYCGSQALHFDGTEAVKAYIAKSVSSTQVSLTQVIGNVAAGTGLVLKGAANATAEIRVAQSGSSYSDNLLVGVLNNSQSVSASNIYVLVNKSGTVKFADTAGNAATVPAGKAYLQAPAGSRTLNIFFDDENTTGIETVQTGVQEAEVYNMRGQRVAAPGKGLYIIGGKKVIIK